MSIPSTREMINGKDALITVDQNLSNSYNNVSNSIDVSLQDQYSDIVDFYFMIELGSYTLATPTVLDSRALTVTDSTGLVVGEFFGIQDGERNYQGQIQNIAGNIITMDTPLDYTYSTSSQVIRKSRDLNIDGSVTPVIARLGPVPGVKWDITRMLFTMADTDSMDDGKFGGITALTNGVVFRVSGDLQTNNLFNAKTNGELALRAFDVTYSAKAPAGENGLRFRRSFNGPDKNGVVIRLDGDNNDELQIIIQDDLTGLTSFNGVMQGHIVQD